MKSVRAKYWIGGSIAVVAASWMIDWPPEVREVVPLALVVVLGVVGLIGELIALGRSDRSKPRLPRGSFPADGVVGLATMAGVAAEPNARDPRFRRFLRLEPIESGRLRETPATKSAPSLLGRVVLISFFVGRDGRSWSDPEIAQAHASLLKAGGWVEREAARWRAAVNLDLADTYFVAECEDRRNVEITFVAEGRERGPIEAHAVVHALADTSRAAARVGFQDAADLLARINPRVDADVRVWLIHDLRAGRSLAIPVDDTELAGVSLAVCFAREASFPEPLDGAPYCDPVTVVHELLHLFGATDKYGVPLREYPAGTVTSRDIMRLSESSLSRLRIDPGTASELGW